ncbi:MAG: very short patch repair endonuclease [Planctomycetes bacterium]|nr:very short patch repair endonuclease [Planctomycetota bacterium]
MSKIHSKGNATTEERLASLLRKSKLWGWRRHRPLPGRPDFAWPKARVVVFVDGCFWHGHNCGKNIKPRTNAAAWREKIDGNKARDRKVTRLLRQNRWKVIRIWECDLAKRPEQCMARIRKAVASNSATT